jgi:hypothetical protein
MIVFSFSLYGSADMYTKGMIENAKLLSRHFPDARVQVYTADDVPSDIIRVLSDIPQVRIIRVPRKKGILNMFDRFTAIDDPDCSIMFVRDADSRPHARDLACIEDFLRSDKLLHIIRDHYWHGFIQIPGGLWGIRKGALNEPMTVKMERWLRHKRVTVKNDDQRFLTTLYLHVQSKAMIHDRTDRFKDANTPFRVDITDKMFCGQVYRFDSSGEVPEFEP